MQIRAARPDEAGELSELALRSKGHWGYDEDFLARCRAELTLAPGDIERRRTSVAEHRGRILGFVTVQGDPPDGELGMLFVDPPAIGTGVGRRLFQHAVAVAEALGFTRLEIGSEPYAEPFYRAMGATRIGTIPSGTFPGRTLPRMSIATTPARPRATNRRHADS
ncbi:GNAT family N-acetyltransferase [Streptomyces sp. NBC_01808]|uniref:GNAT family N-acetyltransferase n=1 Tax=Streptomyces sp. NBC_01808 TaxID=2975947 RepID=UPI002DD83236|nr:GNAT family N-acetyltransferase [Streptomyces sp. NBC_01808]WSA37661.1 GNAT family N-acetyltransferase [Streptomyces sp. NBC_01808]